VKDEDRERLLIIAERLADLAIRLGFEGQIELNIYEGGGSVNVTERRSFQKRPRT
jgi:hypothetical protein